MNPIPSHYMDDLHFESGTHRYRAEEWLYEGNSSDRVVLPSAYFVRVGPLFYMDASVFGHLPSSLRRGLARNVILVDELSETTFFKSAIKISTLTTLLAMLDSAPLQGRAIELGSREGLLSLAAWRLGASSVLLVDSKADPLRQARRHFAVNGLREGTDFHVIQADLTDTAAIEKAFAIAQGLGGTTVISDIGPWALMPGNTDRYTATNETTMDLIPVNRARDALPCHCAATSDPAICSAAISRR